MSQNNLAKSAADPQIEVTAATINVEEVDSLSRSQHSLKRALQNTSVKSLVKEFDQHSRQSSAKNLLQVKDKATYKLLNSSNVSLFKTDSHLDNTTESQQRSNKVLETHQQVETDKDQSQDVVTIVDVKISKSSLQKISVKSVSNDLNSQSAQSLNKSKSIKEELNSSNQNLLQEPHVAESDQLVDQVVQTDGNHIVADQSNPEQSITSNLQEESQLKSIESSGVDEEVELKDKVTELKIESAKIGNQLTILDHQNASTQISVGSATTITTVAENIIPTEKIEVSTPDPERIDESLNTRKFVPPNTNEEELESEKYLNHVLQLNYNGMTAAQREQCRAYLKDFISFLTPLSKFQNIDCFQYNSALIDLLFKLSSDQQNPFLDLIFGLLTIMSRNVKNLSPQKGNEPRISKIIDVIKNQSTPITVLREATKSLINFAEPNSKQFLENGWLTALMFRYGSFMGDMYFQSNILWFLRNVTVEEYTRKFVLDKMGFLIVNSLNNHTKESSVCEHAFWLLGNLCLATETTTNLQQMGAFTALKQTLTSHPESLGVNEAVFWFLHNATYDQMAIRTILRSQMETLISNSFTKFSGKSSRLNKWGNLVIKRVNAVIRASSPQVIAERLANRILREGYLNVKLSELDKLKNYYCILYQNRIVFTIDKEDDEIQHEIKFKDVLDISTYPPIVKKTKADSDEVVFVNNIVKSKEMQDGGNTSVSNENAQTDEVQINHSPASSEVKLQNPTDAESTSKSEAVIENDQPELNELKAAQDSRENTEQKIPDLVNTDTSVIIQQSNTQDPLIKTDVDINKESKNETKNSEENMDQGEKPLSITEELEVSKESRAYSDNLTSSHSAGYNLSNTNTKFQVMQTIVQEQEEFSEVQLSDAVKDAKAKLEGTSNKMPSVKSMPAIVKQIKITSKTKSYIIENPDLKLDMESWLTEFKTNWKSAVSAVTENVTPTSPDEKRSSALNFQFFMNSQETIPEKELEKYCLATILHEVYTSPQYLMHQFKCQKDHPDIAVWDFFAAKFTRQTAIKFISEKSQEFYIKNKEMFDCTKMKEAMSKIVEDILMEEVEQFEKKPDFVDAPKVLTKYEYCAKQGIRPTMEDKHVHLPYIDYLVSRSPSKSPISYYAVYDGHGGVSVANFVETHLHYNIMKHPDLDTDIEKTIKESFLQTQQDLKDASDRLYMSTSAGSTGVIVMFKDNKMYCAWVGDSLGSLYREKEIIELVDPPHKPGREQEKARIEKLGGFVSEEGGILRTNGVVAVSRSFGNIKHRVIIPDADIRVIEMRGDEQYLVLACDGLWDVMTPQAVRKFVKKYMKKSGNKTQGISEALVDESLRLGSTDNVSVIFIEFYSWKEPKRN